MHFLIGQVDKWSFVHCMLGFEKSCEYVVNGPNAFNETNILD